MTGTSNACLGVGLLRQGRGGGRQNILRGGVGPVMTEGEVASVEVDEEIREDKQSDEHHAGEEDDEEEVGLVGCTLLDFH